ncbi:MAG: hypothetical protein J3R72DRAFT_475616 [Linnemannia gamsii]|nr:MAG: hypothetical protein J3R72DRAFT_475616 [Linnemannia gamsii]
MVTAALGGRRRCALTHGPGPTAYRIESACMTVSHPCSSNRHTSTNNVQLAFIDSYQQLSLYTTTNTLLEPKILMSAAKEKTSGGSRPTTSSPDQSGSTRVKTSRLVQLEQATKNLFRFSIRKKDRTVPNANTAIQSGSIGVIVPQEQQGGVTLALVDTTVKDLTSLPSAIHQYPVAPTSGQPNNNEDLTPLTSITLRSITTLSTSDSSSKAAAVPVLPAPAPCDRMNIFLENVITPYLKISLPPPGVRLDTTMQLAYCNQLLRTHLSPSLAVAIITTGLDSSQQASVDALLQDKEEHNKVRELAIRVVEEFVANSLKSSEEIAEVILLGPYLDQEYYRKLLNCFIAEFEAAKLLDVDLLRGLVQLVQCAGADYLQPDDLVRVLVVLRTRLQDTHQQTTKHPYCLAIALSRLLDVMVEGKVKDLRRVVDHEPLSALLGQLMESADPYLKHQATYALQGLLHIPNDETRRQFVLRHAGNIVMGLLGVASVCNLDLNGLSDGAGKLRDTTVSALKIGGEVVSGTQSIYENGQGIAASVKGGIFSGGRLLWYSALREARGHRSALQSRNRVPMGSLYDPWRDFY